MFSDRRRFANFFFGWQLDKACTRLVFYTILDVNGRNIEPFGKSLRRYNRWVEEGYTNELMRLTDYMNSLSLHIRKELVRLSLLNPMRPSEELVSDLWALAKRQIGFNCFYRKYIDTSVSRPPYKV